MYCPQCGSPSQSEDLKFCIKCGANLNAVRVALANPEKLEEKGDWWTKFITEMKQSGEEHLKYQREQNNPEQKRYNEIKAGVITGSVGLALMIFLAIFMQGLVSVVDADAAAILRHVWVAGIIPFFVGLALIFNGLVVTKKMAELRRRELQQKDTGKMLEAEPGGEKLALPTTNWYEPEAPSPSITEHTTRQLRDSEQRQ